MMNLGRSIAYGILRDLDKAYRHKAVYARLQSEAASRPESRQVQTPWGPIWMSPIEHKLYEAMVQDGLSPVPQLCIEGYYADFAFLDVQLAVEADGAAYHAGDSRQRDRPSAGRRRDRVLGAESGEGPRRRPVEAKSTFADRPQAATFPAEVETFHP